MEVTFLGTGAGIPSKKRNVTALIVNLLAELNELWLFDCGEATQHQLLHTSIKPRKISKIFITHLHGDHIFGLPGFLSSRSFLGGISPLTIYGPIGIKEFVETTLKISTTHLTYPIHYVEMDEGGMIFEDVKVKVDSVILDHGIKSFGFRIKEKDKLGKLHVEKLKALGIMPGSIYQQIKENESTVLEDDTIIKRSDFLGNPKKGKQLVIFGDTRYLPQHQSFIKGSDLLIHEATFSDELAELAKDYYHTTTVQAAQLAKDSEVKALIITHVSSRYQSEDEVQLLSEAQGVFPDTFMANDFFTYPISE